MKTPKRFKKIFSWAQKRLPPMVEAFFLGCSYKIYFSNVIINGTPITI